MSEGTHLIVCKDIAALDYLLEESMLLGLRSKKKQPVSQGDALVARDILTEGGYLWGTHFYLKKV